MKCLFLQCRRAASVELSWDTEVQHYHQCKTVHRAHAPVCDQHAAIVLEHVFTSPSRISIITSSGAIYSNSGQGRVFKVTMQLDAFILSPEQQRAERERLRRLFRPFEPSRQSPPPEPEPIKTFRQLAGVGEPYRAGLNALAAAVLDEWPEVAPSALFGRSRDADDLEARCVFLALARKFSPLRPQRIAAIVGYDRSVASRAATKIELAAENNTVLAEKIDRITRRIQRPIDASAQTNEETSMAKSKAPP
jgi:hypothetical protein